MNIGYKVYFHEKGIGEMKWGIITTFRLSQKAEAVDMVNRLKSGDLAYYDNEIGWLNPDKYDFGYMEASW